MSYARSPRAVCSTTIGTRFNAVSLNLSLLTMNLRRHELFEALGFVGDLCLREQMLDDLILEHARFDLRHHLAVAAVNLRRLLRILVRGRKLIDAPLSAGPVRFDPVLANQFLNEQADRDPPVRGGLET